MLGFDTVRGGSLTYSDTDTRAIKSHRHYQKDLFLGKQTLNTARRKGVKKKKNHICIYIFRNMEKNYDFMVIRAFFSD